MKFVRMLLLTFIFGLGATAQIPDLEPRVPNGITPIPTVAFTFEMNGADPEHYDLAVQAKGRAAYRSTGHHTTDSPGSASGDPYILKFTMSPATTREIFDLTTRAHDFEKPVAYTKGRLANMGAKTLTYSDEKVFHQQTYNYSEMAGVQQLTEIFQNMSSTLEAGRRLEYMYKYEKLGVDEELKSLEEQAKANRTVELQALTPILKQIAEDESVLNISRKTAEKLLKMSRQESVARGQ